MIKRLCDARTKLCSISISRKTLLDAINILSDCIPPKPNKKMSSSSRAYKSPNNSWNGQAPTRSSNGTFHFNDFPQFLPNKSPKEILQAGSFGGTYFRPIKSAVCPRVKFGDEVWKELPEDWIQGLDPNTHLCSNIYYPSVNKYGVKCGASLEEWEQSGWIKPQGRRTEDDARQVSRWIACAGDRSGRWRNRLCSLVFRQGKEFDDRTVSPVIRQTLLHWGYELTEADYQAWGRRQGAVAESASSPPSSSSSRKRSSEMPPTQSRKSNNEKYVDKPQVDAAKESIEGDEEIVSNMHFAGKSKVRESEENEEQPPKSSKRRRR